MRRGSTDGIRGAARGGGLRRLVACLLVCAAAHVARAGDLSETAQDAIDALRAGDAAQAVAVLSPDDVGRALAADPALLHVVCDRAWRYEDASRAAGDDARRGLSARLLALAESAATAAPRDPRACWSLAHALVLRERTGPRAGAAAWLRAAAALETADHEAPGGGEALGYAVTFLLEGACTESADQHALLKRAAEICRDAARAHGDSVTLAATLGSAHLWAARTLLATNRKLAKSELQAAFEVLEKPAKASLPNEAAASLWNDGVTLDRTAGFALRERYVTLPETVLDGALVVDLPIGSRWVLTRVPESDEQAAYEYVTEIGDDGRALRQLIFRRYVWGRSYSLAGPNQVNGDEVKNIAKGLQALTVERLFAPGARAPSPQKGGVGRDRQGKDLAGQVFEVTGSSAGEDSGPLAVRGYCVRGSRQASLAVLVYVFGGYGTLDPETEAVLAALHEPEE